MIAIEKELTSNVVRSSKPENYVISATTRYSVGGILRTLPAYRYAFFLALVLGIVNKKTSLINAFYLPAFCCDCIRTLCSENALIFVGTYIFITGHHDNFLA